MLLKIGIVLALILIYYDVNKVADAGCCCCCPCCCKCCCCPQPPIIIQPPPALHKICQVPCCCCKPCCCCCCGGGGGRKRRSVMFLNSTKARRAAHPIAPTKPREGGQQPCNNAANGNGRPCPSNCGGQSGPLKGAIPSRVARHQQQLGQK